MALPDFNLLVTLDAVLTEGSVVGAAKRLRLSPSAMSRALTRVRDEMGDPLLVRAGRGLVPTPRAAALREPVRKLVEEIGAILRPVEAIDLSALSRTFTIRTSDGFVENFGARLIAQVRCEAPGVRLNFIQKPSKDSTPRRDGVVDLETGVVEATLGPEVRTQALFRDRLVGVVRDGHPIDTKKITRNWYAEAEHVVVSRTGAESDALDLPYLGSATRRHVASIVGGFSGALAVARASDLVATVPDLHTVNLRQGMTTFSLPMPTMEFTVSMLWHPRMDADPAHRWLRERVKEVCGPETRSQRTRL
jgi:DNA-binding transcriptional LysR family regulator